MRRSVTLSLATLLVGAATALSVAVAPSALSATPPTPPGTPVVSAITTTTLNLTWTPSQASAGLSYYEVYRHVEDYVVLAGRTTTTSFLAQGLLPATNYHFSVRAVDLTGASSLSSPSVSVVTAQVPGGPPYVVQYANMDWSSTPEQILFGMALLNPGTTSVNLSRLSLRYWFTKDTAGSAVRGTCTSASVGCANTKLSVVSVRPARKGADTYARVGFGRAAGVLPAHQVSGWVTVRLVKADGSAFVESNDHSWGMPTPSPITNSHITVYLDGHLVAGTKPSA